MNKIIPYFLASLLAFSGCIGHENLQELMMLGQYSREKDAQNRLVKSTNDHYDALTKAIAQGKMVNYKKEASLENTFGPPILKKDLSDGSSQWLYRYAIYRTARNKVYVYFNRDGKLIKWEKIPCPSFF